MATNPNGARSNQKVNFVERFTQWVTRWVGSVWAFSIACLILIIWATTGPYYRYSDTWQLVINTGTSVVTFLMVFLIQNTQNRDARAIHLKLDELLRAVREARTELVSLEEQPEKELVKLKEEFHKLHEEVCP